MTEFPTIGKIKTDLQGLHVPLLDLLDLTLVPTIEGQARDFLRLKQLHGFVLRSGLVKQSYEELFLQLGKGELQNMLINQVKQNYGLVESALFEAMRQHFNGFSAKPQAVKAHPNLHKYLINDKADANFCYFVMAVFSFLHSDTEPLSKFQQMEYENGELQLQAMASPSLQNSLHLSTLRDPDPAEKPKNAMRAETLNVQMRQQLQELFDEKQQANTEFQLREKQYQLQIKNLTEQLDQREMNFSETKREQRKASTAVQQLNDQNQTLIKECEDLRQQLTSANQQITGMKQKDQHNQQQFEILEKQIKDLEQQFDAAQAQLQQSQQAARDCKEKLNQSLASSQNQNQLKQDLANALRENSTLVEKFNQQQQIMKNLQSDSKQATDERQILKQKNNLLTQRFNDMNQQILQNEERIRQLQTQCDAQQQKNTDLTSEIRDLNRKLVTERQKAQDLETISEKLKRAVQQYQNDIQAIKTECHNALTAQADAQQQCDKFQEQLRREQNEHQNTKNLLEQALRIELQLHETELQLQHMKLEEEDLRQQLYKQQSRSEQLVLEEQQRATLKFESLVTENRQLGHRLAELNATNDELTAEVQELREITDQMDQIQQTLSAKEQKIQQLTEQMERHQSAAKNISKFEQEFTSQREDLRQKDQQLHQTNEELRAVKSQLQLLTTSKHSVVSEAVETKQKVLERDRAIQQCQQQMEKAGQRIVELETQLQITINRSRQGGLGQQLEALQNDFDQLKQDKEFIEQFKLQDVTRENEHLKLELQKMKLFQEQTMLKESELKNRDLDIRLTQSTFDTARDQNIKKQLRKIVEEIEHGGVDDGTDIQMLNALDQDADEFLMTIENNRGRRQSADERLAEVSQKLRQLLVQ